VAGDLRRVSERGHITYSESRTLALGTLLARLRTLEPAMLVSFALIALLLFLVAGPLAAILRQSFELEDGSGYTLANYLAAFGDKLQLTALENSLLLGAGVAALAAVFGVPIAWAVSRTDMPGKDLVRLMVLGAFVIPPYLGAIGWILLAGPNAGWINRLWMALTGAEHGIFNIFSFPGLILAIAVYSYPYTFIFTSAALDAVSSEMEDAAHILGSGGVRTAFKVTLPLVWPAILGGLIISFLEAIALFGTPAIIGLPAHINVVTTQLWQFFEFPVKAEVAAAYALPLLGITAVLFWVQRKSFGRKSFVTITGKGGERRLIELGAWRWPVLGYTWFVAAISVAAALRRLGAGCLQPRLGPRLLARQSDLREFLLCAGRAHDGQPLDCPQLHLRRRHRDAGARLGARHRLCREPPPFALG
jgi:iron(III) transport system permease protein